MVNGLGSILWALIENVLRFIVYKILRLKISDRVWGALLQFVRFSIVGLSNTIIGYLIYAVSLKMLQLGGWFPAIDIFIAQFIMFLLSVLWSFYWNNKAVFKIEDGETRNIFAALVKTYISYAFTGLFLSEILLYVWVDLLGISEYAAPVINLLITVPLNFIIQKVWAFKKTSG